MTNEELMKARYKVIADWPGCADIEGVGIGSIITKPVIYHGPMGFRPDGFPHLFSKLEWWEERKAEDMPEYIRFYMPAREKYYVIKVDTIKETHLGKYVACCGSERYYLGSKDFPATEAEYLASLNTTKQQDNG